MLTHKLYSLLNIIIYNLILSIEILSNKPKLKFRKILFKINLIYKIQSLLFGVGCFSLASVIHLLLFDYFCISKYFVDKNWLLALLIIIPFSHFHPYKTFTSDNLSTSLFPNKSKIDEHINFFFFFLLCLAFLYIHNIPYKRKVYS